MKASLEKIPGDLPGRRPNPVVCSAISRQLDEQLPGSVSKTLVWLLLEYRGSFGAKAFEESDIPVPVKSHLNRQIESIPASRLLLIRQASPAAATAIRLILAGGQEESPALYEWRLPDYEALLSMDFQALINRPGSLESHRRQEPLFLVCTNGRRDPCCARWGQPVFDKLSRAAGELVWQTSHVGGHRFAANVLCFPHGLYYGRLDQDTAAALLSAYQDGQILLPNYRGRACYPAEVQAAEFFLRRETGQLQVNAYRFETSRPTGSGAWEIGFRSRDGQAVYRLAVRREPAPGEIYESCNAGQPVAQTRYSLARFTEIPTREDGS